MKADDFIQEALRTGDYSADDSGAIHSHKNGGDKILRTGLLPTGYRIFTLSIGGKSRSVYAHRFVAIAKLGLPPFGKTEVNHKNGEKGNNNPSNLEWVTPSENSQHTYDTGLRKRISDDPSLAMEIRRALTQKESRRSIAIRLGINKNTVNAIALRVSHN